MLIRAMAKLNKKLRIFNRCYNNESEKIYIIESGMGNFERTHIKTGNKYIFFGEVINKTDGNDGQKMVLYSDGSKLYVREEVEFNSKFIGGRKFKVFNDNKEWVETNIEDMKDGDIFKIFDNGELYTNPKNNQSEWIAKGEWFTNENGIKTINTY